MPAVGKEVSNYLHGMVIRLTVVEQYSCPGMTDGCSRCEVGRYNKLDSPPELAESGIDRCRSGWVPVTVAGDSEVEGCK